MNRATALRWFLSVILVAATVAWAPSPASANSPYVVTNFGDPAPNGCFVADCSLREAVIDANAAPGPDTIHVPGRVTLSITGAGEDAAATGDLDILDHVDIVGTAAHVSVIDANGIDRVFDIPTEPASFTSVTITGGNAATSKGGGLDIDGETTFRDVLITGNFAANEGGGFDSNDDIVLIDTAVTNNIADDGGGFSSNDEIDLIRSVVSGNTASDNGGGIENEDSLRAVESIIAGNVAVGEGGGVWADAEDTEEDNFFRRSTISGNNASGGGGGIWNHAGPLLLDNTTVSGNVTNGDGGGVYNNAATSITILSATISGNRADLDGNNTGNGGGISLLTPGMVALGRSVVADNVDGPTTTHPDCSGALASLGFNVVENLTGCTGITNGVDGDASGDPALGPLSNNGGPTATHAIGIASIARDRISTKQPDCKKTADQRGVPRPADQGCDSGAYELRFCGSLPVSVVGTNDSEVIDGTASDDGILALSGNDMVNAGAGDDQVCGGNGNDKLFGGDGDDFLNGQAGAKDRCFGEADADTFKGCEKKKQG